MADSSGMQAPPGDEDAVLTLRLYVAGDAPNSVEARANLASMLAGRPPGAWRLEVIDFLRDPQRALADGVIVTPTLVRLSPPPIRKIVGSLRDTASVLAAIGLAGTSPA